jgi:hypothetical protein
VLTFGVDRTKERKIGSLFPMMSNVSAMQLSVRPAPAEQHACKQPESEYQMYNFSPPIQSIFCTVLSFFMFASARRTRLALDLSAGSTRLQKCRRHATRLPFDHSVLLPYAKVAQPQAAK